MMKLLSLALALTLVIAGGVVHGLASNRWGPMDSGRATGDVAALPRTVSHWVGRDQELDPRQLSLGSIQAACSRCYDNRATGAALNILVLYGPSGPITVHTPDLCFPGAGYEIVGTPAKQILTARGVAPAEFWAAKARKADPGRVTYLRLLWAWNAGGQWEAPDYPRLAFCHSPMIYKLYMVQKMSGPDEPLLNEECADFLRGMLPGLDPVLFRQN
ncbi:MAG: EpsI family protein [Gemmataceae bacterium]|nr:EpsI family protein [Gemmataceae bacterium]